MRKLVTGFLILLTAVLGVLGWGYWQLQQFAHRPVVDTTRLVHIPAGSSARALPTQLASQGIVLDRRWFIWYLRTHPELAAVRAGSYELQPGWNIGQVLQQLVEGREASYRITLIEGDRFRDWARQLKQYEQLQVATAGMSEAEIAKAIGAPHGKLEGWLLPETYQLRYGTTDLQLYRRAFEQMQAYLNQVWDTRAEALPLENPYQALILASIIEKETGVAEERPLIASVFINRLQRGMRLQTDPTVIYGMGDSYDGDITRKALRQPTPYNTYVIAGLPPTPIAMPGKAAIQAALHPAQTSYLYFVSKGNGRHHFSKTLAEHNRAVNKYILKR